MKKYNPAEIEGKWQKKWLEDDTFACHLDSSKPKYYALIEFPYPSGSGLHVGHPRPYTAMDVVARKKRLDGHNVLFSMGWDAFGLPAENYAIKVKKHPREIVEVNVERFKSQLQRLGYSFDWNREINTTDEEYYKWTQWIFLKLFEKGLAYKKEMMINWCPSCKIGLANEEVIQGTCERCHGEVEQRPKSQWMLKITEYAGRLIDDLDEVDFIDRVKAQQKNWIGRSHGASMLFKTSVDESLEVYTTRPDTVFGATYMVLSPEHPVIDKYKDIITNFDEIEAYRKETSKKSEFERSELNKDKTGVEIKGIYAINPLTEKQIPIWISDYVLMSYGTGAIMAVPAHDERDFEFATKFGIPMLQVVEPKNHEKIELPYVDTENGVAVNSDFLNGLTVTEAKAKMIEHLEKLGIGKGKVNYKLRDWVFSRQRYWGEPIPLVICDKCGYVPVPENELPLTLPEVANYEPTDNGESPLANITEWVNTTCPKCGGHAKRETDTMPQWAGSSWYFLRYTDPKNKEALASKEALNYFMPVDWYNGGMEHTTLHLLYSRFWHKFLYDIGVVDVKEPYRKRTSHGMILRPDGNGKMAKSGGDFVSPDELINEYGADAFRTYIMFIGDFEKSIPWNNDGPRGTRKYLERVWSLLEILNDSEQISEELEVLVNKTIKKVSYDYVNLKFNTAIAQLMTLLNEIKDKGSITRKELEIYLILLNPVAPHITEEMWQIAGFKGEISGAEWPTYDESKLVEDTIAMPVQVNGKLRGTVILPLDATEEQAKEIAFANERVKEVIEGKTVVKIVYVSGKIFNIVVK